MRWLLLVLALACAGRSGRGGSTGPIAGASVRLRPVDPPHALAQQVMTALPHAQWDAGLEQALQSLVLASTQRTSVLDTRSTSLALASAGFPAQARIRRKLNGGAFPDDLLDQAAVEDGPVDVAMAQRSYGDGTVLWLFGWAPRLAELDPLPRDLGLDDTLAVHVELPRVAEARLFVAVPEGPVQELSLTPGIDRWLDLFHTPGEYRLEVVAQQGGIGQVVLLFSVWVEGPPPPLRPLAAAPGDPPDPSAAEARLYAALDDLRRQRGLPALTPFPLFEPLAREHAALMAAHGDVRHVIDGVTPGVAVRAGDLAHPRARHHQNVAAALTADEALALVMDSPGHLQNLLCERCTHASIGVALEPVLDRRPRLFVTWEVLEFPQGPPQKIDRFNR